MKKEFEPLVSVVMNCYNSEKFLKEAIDSVVSQTYQNWEIIFWDNASTDNSAQIVKAYADQRIRYFRGVENVPLGLARNFALEKCSGEYIAFLDCDDIWMPTKLQIQIPLFLKSKTVGLVYSDSYFFNEEGVHKRIYSKRKPYRGSCFPELLNNYLISLETAVINKRALDTLTYWFDPRFNMIEEYDLFLRIGLSWNIDYSSEVLAKWRVHQNSWSWKYPKKFAEEARVMVNEMMLDAKNYGPYYQDLQIALSRLEVDDAINLWRDNFPAEARSKIKLTNLKNIAIYASTFLPFVIVEKVYRYIRGTLTPS